MFGNRRNELTLAGLLAWLTISAGVFIVLALPFVVPQHQLAQFIPECQWQSQFQKPCVFCGMSTAFYAISRGDFTGAYHINSLSLYIYSAFLLNTLVTVFTLKRSTRFLKNLTATLRRCKALS